MKLPTNRPPVHPGEILAEEFMRPYGMTIADIATRIGTKPALIQQLVNGDKNLDADMALRLSKLFSTSPELWLYGQIAWDIWHVMYGFDIATINAIEPVKTRKILAP